MSAFQKSSVTQLIPSDVAALLEKHKYHLIGRHSAVKRCLWVKKKLTENVGCYKQEFYGIQSHRCLQMSPAHVFCTHRCIFCWRIQPQDSLNKWDDTKLTYEDCDPPHEIVEQAIKTQKQILGGYNPIAHPKVSKKLYTEALDPKHVAISLSGEPTLYPFLSGLIETFHRRGLTTFLVTNGSFPKVLSELVEPTQLYVTLPATNQRTYLKVCRPTQKGLWKSLKQTLELLPSFSCPTVLRLTLVKEYNMKDIEGYARLIDKANPTYIETKGYVHVGWSQKRLRYEHMPNHQEILDFAHHLGISTNYNLLNDVPISRVALLSRLKKPIRFGGEKQVTNIDNIEGR